MEPVNVPPASHPHYVPPAIRGAEDLLATHAQGTLPPITAVQVMAFVIQLMRIVVVYLGGQERHATRCV